MDLPTYTNIWRIEKRLYKLYDFRLPMPLPVGQIAVFLVIAVPYVLILSVLGLPFSHTLLWLYVLPPGVLAWLTTRPVLEGKRLPELVISQVRYLLEPRTWCRMAPLAEKDEISFTCRVWRRAEPVADAAAVAAAVTTSRRSAAARPLAISAGPASASPALATAASADSVAGSKGATSKGAAGKGGTGKGAFKIGAGKIGGRKGRAQRMPARPPAALRTAAPRIVLAPPSRQAAVLRPSEMRQAAEQQAAAQGQAAEQAAARELAARELAQRAAARNAATQELLEQELAAREMAAREAARQTRAGNEAAQQAPPLPAESGQPAPGQPVSEQRSDRLARLAAGRPAGAQPPARMPAARPMSAGRPAQALGPALARPVPGESPATHAIPGQAAPAPEPAPPAAQSLSPRPSPTPPAPAQPAPPPSASVQATSARRASAPPISAQPPAAPATPAERSVASAEVASAGSQEDAAPANVMPARGMQAEPTKAEPDQAVPDQAVPDQAGHDQSEPEQAESRQAKPEQAEPEHDQAETDQAEPFQGQGDLPDDLAAAAPPPRTTARPVVTVTGDTTSERPLRVVERALRSQPGRRQDGWRDRVVVVPGGHRPGKPDQMQRDRARARLAVHGHRRIVVLGCTRGAGQTVTALLVGDTLARLRNEPVAVLDLNRGKGSLADRAAAIPGLLSGPPPGGSAAWPDLADAARPGNGLQVIDGSAATAADDAGRLIDLVAGRYPLTLADPAASCVPRALAAADVLLIVAPASAEAVSALGMTFEWLEAHGHGGLAETAITVLNGVSTASRSHVEHAATVASGRCHAVVSIPWDGRLNRLSPPDMDDVGPADSGTEQGRAHAPRSEAPAHPAFLAAPAAPAGPVALSPALVHAYTALAGVLIAGLADPENGRSVRA